MRMGGRPSACDGNGLLSALLLRCKTRGKNERWWPVGLLTGMGKKILDEDETEQYPKKFF